jgi:hypothetical protein
MHRNGAPSPAQIRLREKSDLSSRIKLIWVVQSGGAK